MDFYIFLNSKLELREGNIMIPETSVNWRAFEYKFSDISTLGIEIGIAQTTSGYLIDNEHIDYAPVPFNDCLLYTSRCV